MFLLVPGVWWSHVIFFNSSVWWGVCRSCFTVGQMVLGNERTAGPWRSCSPRSGYWGGVKGILYPLSMGT